MLQARPAGDQLDARDGQQKGKTPIEYAMELVAPYPPAI